MFKWIIIVFALVSFTVNPDMQQAKIIKFNKFQSLEREANSDRNDTVYVFNFFATWCKPCVHELPGFEKLSAAYKGQKVKFTFISLDFAKDFQSKLIPFIKQKNIQSQVYLLDEPDYNSWIDKVDKSWGGSIPATIVINSSHHFYKFYETEMAREDLENIIKPLVTQ